MWTWIWVLVWLVACGAPTRGEADAAWCEPATWGVEERVLATDCGAGRDRWWEAAPLACEDPGDFVWTFGGASLGCGAEGDDFACAGRAGAGHTWSVHEVVGRFHDDDHAVAVARWSVLAGDAECTITSKVEAWR